MSMSNMLVNVREFPGVFGDRPQPGDKVRLEVEAIVARVEVFSADVTSFGERKQAVVSPTEVEVSLFIAEVKRFS